MSVFDERHGQNTYNFTLLAGSAFQFSPLVLLADHSHVCKCWTSNPKRENNGGYGKFNVCEIIKIRIDKKNISTVECFLLCFVLFILAHSVFMRIFF